MIIAGFKITQFIRSRSNILFAKAEIQNEPALAPEMKIYSNQILTNFSKNIFRFFFPP